MKVIITFNPSVDRLPDTILDIAEKLLAAYYNNDKLRGILFPATAQIKQIADDILRNPLYVGHQLELPLQKDKNTNG